MIIKTASIMMLTTVSINTYAECTPSAIEATPTARFTPINSGSEVKDNVTGLIWQRCAIGQVWNQNTCSASIEAKQLTWHEALKEAKALGNGYRLPNIRELHSIVEPRCSNPSVNSTVFPNAVSGLFWSSTPKYVAYSQYVDFSSGDSYHTHNDNIFYARAVRSE